MEDSDFRRETPLLLLLYLSIEGQKSRRHLADLFWPAQPERRQRLNNLSRLLTDLRRHAPGSFYADVSSVRSEVGADVLEFTQALSKGAHRDAQALCRGGFLAGCRENWRGELAEWLGEQRRRVAAQVWSLTGSLAAAAASRGHFNEAARQVAKAAATEDIGVLEPAQLVLCHTVLSAADHPLTERFRDEAADYTLELAGSRAEAQQQLRASLIGREAELARLKCLEPGSWVWLQGARSTGKTSLLKSLPGTLLPARSYTPLETLAPLLSTPSGAQDLLAQSLEPGDWLFDDWTRIDAESRAQLGALRRHTTQVRVIIAAEGPPPFPVDTVLELGPLSPGALGAYPGVWEATGGLPALVGAYLRGETLGRALSALTATLEPSVRDVYFSLALLETPSPDPVRRALALDAAELANALNVLLEVHLAKPDAQVRGRSAALELLELQPAYAGPLALRLAQQLPPLAAFALYRQARPFWAGDDEVGARRAYLAKADVLRQQGNIADAEALLAELPPEAERGSVEDWDLSAQGVPREPTARELRARVTGQEPGLQEPTARKPTLTEPSRLAPGPGIKHSETQAGTVGRAAGGPAQVAASLKNQLLKPRAFETCFACRWAALHAVGFLLVTFFYLSRVPWAVGATLAVTLGVLATLLYLGWQLVRRESQGVNWWGVAVAFLAGGTLTLGLQGLSVAEYPVLLGSSATVVGMGVTMGAVRGWLAAFVGTALATVGALFAASLLTWLGEVTPATAVLPFTVQLAFGIGAAAWAYALARVVLASRRPLRVTSN